MKMPISLKSVTALAAVVWLSLLHLHAVTAFDEKAQEIFFERKIRPLLSEHCLACHGNEKQESSLRLDSRAAILKGGDSGPAVDLKSPESSLLIDVVRHRGEIQMPPDGKLNNQEIAALQNWIDGGVYWPASTHLTESADVSDKAAEHWAFQPIRRPAVPQLQNDSQGKSEIDRFILRRLDSNQLMLASPAEPNVLIRRVTLGLLGLPPEPEDVRTFVEHWKRNPEKALECLLDRLLDSPHYGEHQARQWLDIARYADNKGYVFFEEKNFPWAWTYRDWVVQSFNEDLPYDQFIVKQIAADLLPERNPESLAAMGFLTLGPRFMNNTHDIIDDRIDVVARGLLALTVSCARCHSHKFDPISQEDYYSLYGVFRSSREPALRPLIGPEPATDEYRQFNKGLGERIEKLESFIHTQRLQMMEGARQRAAEYLLAAHRKRHHPSTENFMLLTEKGAIIPAMLHRWEVYLKTARQRQDPVWSIWFAYSDMPAEDLEAATDTVRNLIAERGDLNRPNAIVAEAFRTADIHSMTDVAAVYGKVFAAVDEEWRQKTKADHHLTRFTDRQKEQLRQVLYGTGSPPMVPTDLGWGFLDLLPDRPTQGEYRKLLGEVEKYSRSAPGAPPRGMVLVDNSVPYDPVVFRRGNPNRPGQQVPRRFLNLLAGAEQKPFSVGSGRLELARAIASPGNPLTARVIVNRIWQQHFGTGLVETASDFGRRSEPPSHPDLMDWLASQFIADGWSLKRLHRRIISSAVYRQSATVSRDLYEKAMSKDSSNRLLWRYPRRRLSFEATRDAHLFVSGNMDRSAGGPPVDVLNGYNTRRTLYGFVNRMDLPGLMRTFDFPEPAATSPGREATTVPQQALFFLNHDFVRETARRIVRRQDVRELAGTDQKVTQVYRLLFARDPDHSELTLARSFLSQSKPEQAPLAWRYGYGGVDEQLNRVNSFTELTHWTGSRLQAGDKLPDPEVGWVFHDRTGGHPASSDDRCFILRWVSPIRGRVTIRGTLTHRPEEGNGVRGRVFTGDGQRLGEWRVDQSESETTVTAIRVERGSTIDFVVDWQGHITHDEFEWPVVIHADNVNEARGTEADRMIPANVEWSSRDEFRQQRSDPWTDYLHGLLMTNEFVFVD